RGYRGPIGTIDVSGDWGVPLAEVPPLFDMPEWNVAVVLDSSQNGLTVGIRPAREVSGKIAAEREEGAVAADDMSWAMRHYVEGERVRAKSPAEVLKPGDVIYVQKKADSDSAYELRQLPEVGGGMVTMDPHTGRVLALVGGFSYSASEFN